MKKKLIETQSITYKFVNWFIIPISVGIVPMIWFSWM
jgi:hypothetical protein